MSNTERTVARPKRMILGASVCAICAAALVSSAGCDQAPSRPKDDFAKAAKGEPAGGARAKVASIHVASGGLEGLTAQDAAGVRALSPGDGIASGQTIRTDAGVEAIVSLEDETAVLVREGSRVTLGRGDADAALTVEAGEVSVSRPTGAKGLSVKAQNTAFSLIGGRATILVEESGDGRLTVEAGEVEIAKSAQRLRLGQGARFDRAGGLTLEREAYVSASYVAAQIAPLVPDAVSPVPRDLLRGIGTLTARVPGTGKTNEQALRLAKHDVKATIREGVAMTRIEEAFTNDSGRTVEATYKLLIPSGASITRLALEVDGRIEEGEVLEKDRARRIFKQIVDDSVRPRDPALLEWERGSSFSMKIFPIAPGETRRVFVTYVEPLTAEGGRVRYVYPMGGPAGSPDIGEFSIGVDVESPHGISALRTPLFPTEIDAAEDRAEISFAANGFAPSVDFVLEYAPRKEPARIRTFTETEKNGQAYAMAIVRPDVEGAAKSGPARLVLAVDTSYGISEELRALSTSTVLELVAGLGPDDSFGVLACDSGCRPLFSGFARPSRELLARVRELLDGIEPGGASDLLGAMEHAFAMADDGVSTSVVYIGDAVPTSGELDPGELLRILRQTRPANVAVQTIGIGPDVDSVLLDAMAANLGGSSYRLSVGESPALAAWNIARRMWAPGLRDVEIQWPAGVVAGHPTRVGFLPNGTELMLTAALAQGGSRGEVRILATAPDGSPWERTFALEAPAREGAAGYVGKLWAKAHLDALELAGGRDAEIVELSRRMRVASRLTSWLVLENERMYERFKVQRTDAEEWDGTAAAMTEVEEAKDEAQGAIPEDDLDALAVADVASPAGGARAAASSGDADFGAGTGKGGGGFASAAPAAQAPAKSAEHAGDEARKRESLEDAKTKKAAPAMGSAAGRDDLEASISLGGLATTAGESMGRPLEMGGGCGYRTEHNVTIGGPRSYGAAAEAKAGQLQAAVAARPLSREAHRRYVGYLSRLGDLSRATGAAEAWRAADPMGTDALTAYADQVARTGDRARAARIYASLAELSPRSWRTHQRLAQALSDLGWYGAAAGHYRAAAATGAKAANEHALDYLLCLAASGQRALLEIEAERISSDRARRAIRGEVAKLVAGARQGLLPAWKPVEPSGALKVRLEIDTPGVDLDLAVIDPAGRRVSGLWRRGATARDMGVAGEEVLALASMTNGTYQILISRATPGAAPIGGRVVVKAMHEHRVLPFTLVGSEVSVGQVRYSKTERYRCGY